MTPWGQAFTDLIRVFEGIRDCVSIATLQPEVEMFLSYAGTDYIHVIQNPTILRPKRIEVTPMEST